MTVGRCYSGPPTAVEQGLDRRLRRNDNRSLSPGCPEPSGTTHPATDDLRASIKRKFQNNGPSEGKSNPRMLPGGEQKTKITERTHDAPRRSVRKWGWVLPRIDPASYVRSIVFKSMLGSFGRARCARGKPGQVVRRGPGRLLHDEVSEDLGSFGNLWFTGSG